MKTSDIEQVFAVVPLDLGRDLNIIRDLYDASFLAKNVVNILRLFITRRMKDGVVSHQKLDYTQDRSLPSARMLQSGGIKLTVYRPDGLFPQKPRRDCGDER